VILRPAKRWNRRRTASSTGRPAPSRRNRQPCRLRRLLGPPSLPGYGMAPRALRFRVRGGERQGGPADPRRRALRHRKAGALPERPEAHPCRLQDAAPSRAGTGRPRPPAMGFRGAPEGAGREGRSPPGDLSREQGSLSQAPSEPEPPPRCCQGPARALPPGPGSVRPPPDGPLPYWLGPRGDPRRNPSPRPTLAAGGRPGPESPGRLPGHAAGRRDAPAAGRRDAPAAGRRNAREGRYPDPGRQTRPQAQSRRPQARPCRGRTGRPPGTGSSARQTGNRLRDLHGRPPAVNGRAFPRNLTDRATRRYLRPGEGPSRRRAAPDPQGPCP
jgi:hypothetical protein